MTLFKIGLGQANAYGQHRVRIDARTFDPVGCWGMALFVQDMPDGCWSGMGESRNGHNSEL